MLRRKTKAATESNKTHKTINKSKIGKNLGKNDVKKISVILSNQYKNETNSEWKKRPILMKFILWCEVKDGNQTNKLYFHIWSVVTLAPTSDVETGKVNPFVVTLAPTVMLKQGK